jgi:hypothetical protein
LNLVIAELYDVMGVNEICMNSKFQCVTTPCCMKLHAIVTCLFHVNQDVSFSLTLTCIQTLEKEGPNHTWNWNDMKVLLKTLRETQL